MNGDVVSGEVELKRPLLPLYALPDQFMYVVETALYEIFLAVVNALV
jgi:hypothetical protein